MLVASFNTLFEERLAQLIELLGKNHWHWQESARADMRIVCPNCGYSRDTPEEKIPATASRAMCPKCGEKFSLRGEEKEEDFSSPEQQDGQSEMDSPEQSASEQVNGSEDLAHFEGRGKENPSGQEKDIWRQLEELEENGEAPPNPAWEAGGDEVLEEPSSVPWENLQEHGLFSGLTQTVKQVLFEPARFFAHMPLGVGKLMPLIFYVLLMEVQILSHYMWTRAGVLAPPEASEGLLGVGLLEMGLLGILVLYPLFMAVSLFFMSGVYHLCLMALQDGEMGFEGTYKVVSYSSAAMVFTLVPVLGIWIGGVWQLVCTFLGFRHVHGTSSAKAVFAILLPVILMLFFLSVHMMLRGSGLA